MRYELVYTDSYGSKTRIEIDGEDDSWMREELEKERIAYGWPESKCEVVELW